MTFGRFLAWADKRNLIAVRTATLGVTIWMTWRVTEWAFLLSHEWMAGGKNGFEAAAVIAAVTAPFTALQTMVFRGYMDAKD